ncbi:HDOD domain-containing protein [Litorilituus sediminis]|uniref:HDOD domain-containing protein n=1 Tax=Litorilituus sediminis TaxID=718192 RepID=A0A4V0ZGE9_9GAMM|nr:HDOD domain-containing protein [Litorilituus sediminis]QBG37060.1 HDOD domain-containing protein [Litorilituus sediminis]
MLIVDQSVLDDISKGFSVPAQPKLLLKLLKLMAEHEPDIKEIAHTISQDVAVSAAILKAINSPLYGLSRTVTDIQMSVNYIGLYGIIMLVTGSLIKKSFDPKSCSIELEPFWQMSTDVSTITVLLGRQFKSNLAADKLFSLGLFHDCGVPVMAMKYSNYQATLDSAITAPETSLIDLEENNYKANHAVIGYYVASSWRLPKDICQIILQHHDRYFLDRLDNSDLQDYYAILKLAEHIVHLKYHEVPSADWAFVQDNVLYTLGIKESGLDTLISDMQQKI